MVKILVGCLLALCASSSRRTVDQSIEKRAEAKVRVFSVRHKNDLNRVLYNVVMIGNPGTGKSTILNSLMGSNTFESGFSIGSSLTFQLDVKEANRVRYMDTPGLADMTLRKQAARAIKEAMMQGGKFKIFFVVCLQAGRVSPQDKATIKLVLQAVPDLKNMNDYSVIVNKVLPDTMTAMNKTGRNGLTGKEKVIASLMQDMSPKTDRFLFAEKQAALEDSNNVLWTAPDELRDFVDLAPQVNVNPKNVKKVLTDMEEMLERLEKKLKDLRKDSQKQQNIID
jgi:GTPase Era involved in 16S rRNA processing